jgi:hypothetical protein
MDGTPQPRDGPPQELADRGDADANYLGNFVVAQTLRAEMQALPLLWG